MLIEKLNMSSIPAEKYSLTVLRPLPRTALTKVLLSLFDPSLFLCL